MLKGSLWIRDPFMQPISRTQYSTILRLLLDLSLLLVSLSSSTVFMYVFPLLCLSLCNCTGFLSLPLVGFFSPLSTVSPKQNANLLTFPVPHEQSSSSPATAFQVRQSKFLWKNRQVQSFLFPICRTEGWLGKLREACYKEAWHHSKPSHWSQFHCLQWNPHLLPLTPKSEDSYGESCIADPFPASCKWPQLVHAHAKWLLKCKYHQLEGEPWNHRIVKVEKDL